MFKLVHSTALCFGFSVSRGLQAISAELKAEFQRTSSSAIANQQPSLQVEIEPQSRSNFQCKRDGMPTVLEFEAVASVGVTRLHPPRRRREVCVVASCVKKMHNLAG